MSLLNRDLVEWGSQSSNLTDDLGHPVYTSDGGYPVTVRGHFQHSGSDSTQSIGGLDKTVSAVFSSRWKGGKIGDTVSKDEVTYLVVGLDIKRSADKSVNRVLYELTKKTIGTDPDGI